MQFVIFQKALFLKEQKFEKNKRIVVLNLLCEVVKQITTFMLFWIFEEVSIKFEILWKALSNIKYQISYKNKNIEEEKKESRYELCEYCLRS